MSSRCSSAMSELISGDSQGHQGSSFRDLSSVTQGQIAGLGKGKTIGCSISSVQSESDAPISVVDSNSDTSNAPVQRIRAYAAQKGGRGNKQYTTSGKKSGKTVVRDNLAVKQIVKPIVKKKNKGGALADIRRLQKSTDPLIRKAGLRSTARKILQDPDIVNFSHFRNSARISNEGFHMLREALEFKLIKHLEDSLKIALRAKRMTVFPLDLKLALDINGESSMTRDDFTALPITKWNSN